MGFVLFIGFAAIFILLGYVTILALAATLWGGEEFSAAGGKMWLVLTPVWIVIGAGWNWWFRTIPIGFIG